jgi:mycothiol S-conjugate amidase
MGADPTGRSGAATGSVDSVTRVVSPRNDNRLCLLTIHAHPDDEASKGAPTCAMYKAQGVRTVLVCCTGGEEGDLQNPLLREEGQPFHGLTPEEERATLAALRPDELRRSAAIIGFDRVAMLGYRDSGMVDTEPNNHPESFHMAPIDEAIGRLVKIIREERPQVIITYGDDQKFYPHPDHVKVHDISVPAFERAGDPRGTRRRAIRGSRRSCTTRSGRRPG